MCIENITNEEKNKILRACASVLILEEKYKNINKSIEEEKHEREKDIEDIKDNYLHRFDEIKKDIREVRKDIRNSFIGITTFFLLTIIGFILAKIGGLL